MNLDATGQPIGPMGVWPNTGTAGNFLARPAAPRIIMVHGVKGVALPFTGSAEGAFYEGPVAPASICGNASRTIEAWVWDPTPQDEKTILSWGHRDGPDFSNCSFGHGVHAVWGCLGGWGGGDVGYSPGSLVLQGWTYVAYTYEAASQTAKVYQDGVLNNTKTYAAQLNTWATDTTSAAVHFLVGRQIMANGAITTAGIGTNVIAKIRVHDVAMTAAQIQAQYQAEKSQFTQADTDGDGMPDWWEARYGLDPNDPGDATQDQDRDGRSNLQEFLAGSDPTRSDLKAFHVSNLGADGLVRVDAQETIYDGSNGKRAAKLPLPAGASQLRFRVTGGVITDGSLLLASADGLYADGRTPYNFSGTRFNGTYEGLPIGATTGIDPALFGVFLSTNFTGTPPDSLDCRSDADSTNRTLSAHAPGLHQPFWIGDGYDQNNPFATDADSYLPPGKIQTYDIPAGAQFLILGIAADVNMADNQAPANKTSAFLVHVFDNSGVTNTQPVLQIYASVQVTFSTLTGHNYTLQYSTALNPNDWLDLAGPFAGTGDLIYYTDRTKEKRFYRVVMD